MNNSFVRTWWVVAESTTHSSSLLATCSQFCSESTTTPSSITPAVVSFSLSFFWYLSLVCYFFPMPTIHSYVALSSIMEAFSSLFKLISISWLWPVIEHSPIIMPFTSTSTSIPYDKSLTSALFMPASLLRTSSLKIKSLEYHHIWN